MKVVADAEAGENFVMSELLKVGENAPEFTLVSHAGEGAGSTEERMSLSILIVG